MRPITNSGRPAPAWLVVESFEDRQVGLLKSGKEAEVFIVERRSASGSHLLAHKRFRPRHPGPGELRELGFSKGTIYRHDAVYRGGWRLDSREQRAVASRTRYGRDLRAGRWADNELAALRRAWDAGASVPYPLGRTDDGILMELIGDWNTAAPRLASARLSPDELDSAWRQLRRSLAALADAGLVHADLSAYNLLWWAGRLVLIDFPQAVDVASNADALDLLHRDVTNVVGWFSRRGLAIDVDEVYADLVVRTL